MSETLAEFIGNQYPDEEILKAVGYDDCVIGTTSGAGPTRLVYSVSKILAKLMGDFEKYRDEDDDHDLYTEAREFFDFNIAGAYVGEYTPVFVEDEIVGLYGSLHGSDDHEAPGVQSDPVWPDKIE